MNVLTVLCGGGWMPAHLSEGWRRLGADVTEFFYGTHMGKEWSAEGIRRNRAINHDLFETARRLKSENKLDLIFAVIYDDVLNEETARKLRSLQVPLVNYHVDLVGQWQRVLCTGRYFDRLACAQRDHWSALRRAGIRPFYMPMAANPIRKADSPSAINFDGVLYLGSPWEYRTRALAALARAGLPLRISGHGWLAGAVEKFNFQPMGKWLFDFRHYALPYIREQGLGPAIESLTRRFIHRTTGEVPDNKIPADCIRGSYGENDFAPLVRGAAINVGFTNFKGAAGTAGEERQLRLRDFEIPMAGGFYLAQDCAQLRELFHPGQDVMTWDSVDSLIEKARYYLERTEERRRFAATARDYCEKNHSWEARFRGLLRELNIPAPGGAGE